MNSSIKNISLKIVYIAMFAAMLTGGKFVLSAIPNVEIVTLLIVVISTVFGVSIALPVTLVFCSTEFMLYGAGTWVISYFIYWNLLSIISSFILHSMFIKRNERHLIKPEDDNDLIIKSDRPFILIAVIIAFVGTLFFGVISTTVDVILSTRLNGINCAYAWKILYLRGVPFFVTHVVSNTIIMLFAFLPLMRLVNSLNKLKS